MMLSLIGILLLGAGTAYSATCERNQEVVCYWGTWSVYRQSIGEFTTENIDPTLCTNIVYSFVGLDVNSQITSLDTWADIDKGGFANFTALKTTNPCLSTTLAIGGWNEGSIKYSVMAYTEESRKAFADSVLRFLVFYGFDGLDLDWEYPTARGGIPEDGENFAALLKVIKKTISPWGLILTTAVPIDDSLLGTAYIVPKIAEVVDYVHLMAYDYVPSTSKVTGLSAPLSAIKQTVANWVNAGLPKNKLILGIPTYGRNFILEDESKNGIGDPVSDVGLPGDYTSELGFLAYYEVMELVNDPWLNMVAKEEDVTNYAVSGTEWITYETTTTVTKKVEYILEQNLGGVMVWSLDTDDFLGTYGPKFGLLSTINDVLKKHNAK